ncbi:MAG: NAD(P)-dependent oxidoreductase [Uliginosibacterium sp.]|nr:NAD(P)-dependent oxidoreductase [Uliginosibacterium sp.]
MRILLTGATGFIGSHVAVRLAEGGHEVVATGRKPALLPGLASVPGIVACERLELGERQDWPRLLAGCDALVHVALGWGDGGLAMLAADTTASIALFDAACAAGVTKVIYTSSTAANGELDALNDEHRQNRPTDFYGATKAATEIYLRAYAARKAFQAHVVRPGYIFGEPALAGGRAQPDQRFFEICRAVRHGKPVRLIKHDGTQFLHAQDIAGLYLALLEHDAEFSIHYGLSRDWTSWADVAHMAMEVAGRQVPIELEDRGYGAEPCLFDVTAMQQDFGLSFPNAERLRAHVAWVMGQV